MAGLNQIGPDLPAGQMKDRVTIQQPVKAAGRQTWQDLITVWAFIDPTGGGEVARQLDPIYTNSYIVQMRYPKGYSIHVHDRLAFTSAMDGQQTLEIQSVNDVDSRHITLQLVCKQVTG